MGVAGVLPSGFVRIVLLFTATSHAFDLRFYSLRLLPCHMLLTSGFTPWGLLLQVWNLWIPMTTVIVFLFTLVDTLYSFLKHSCTPYLTWSHKALHLLFQVQVAASPATPMSYNHHHHHHHHLSSVSTLLGHLGHEKRL